MIYRFLLLPWILLGFRVNKIAGIVLACIPVIVCIAVRFYLGFYYDFSANLMYPAYPNTNGGNESQDSYFVPWTRMGVYFIAVALMLLIITIDEKMKARKQKFRLPKAVYFGLMWLSGFTLLSLILWPYNEFRYILY